MLRKALFALRHRPDRRLIADRAANYRQVEGLAGLVSEALGLDATRARPKLHWVEHHPAHLASAFFVSPFEEAAVCAIDGFGDFVSTSWGIGRGAHIDVRHRTWFPHSLGLLYLAITQHLGFTHFGDEFKVMGLAPYGRPERVDELRQLISLKSGGRFKLECGQVFYVETQCTREPLNLARFHGACLGQTSSHVAGAFYCNKAQNANH